MTGTVADRSFYLRSECGVIRWLGDLTGWPGKRPVPCPQGRTAHNRLRRQ